MSGSELELWTLDELCDHAFAIFEELAEDNLSAEDYALYQQHASASAYVDLVPATDDWVDMIAMDIDPELHVEARIGLADVNAVAEIVLARILLSKEKSKIPIQKTAFKLKSQIPFSACSIMGKVE